MAIWQNTLHVACEVNDDEIVREVLKRSEGGMVNTVDGSYLTPVQKAVDHGWIRSVIGIMGDQRVDWGVRDNKGRSLPDMARYSML